MKRIALLPLLLLAACDPATTPAATTATAVTATPTPAPTATDMPTTTPTTPGKTSANVAEASNAFGFDLYQRLRDEPGNLALSPMSLSLALSMTYAGAEKETATQMQQVLRLPADVHEGWKAQLASLAESQEVTLEVVNRLYGEQTYDFVPSFLELNAKAYGAPLEKVDFIRGAEKARKTINTWVGTKTQGLIDELIPGGGVDSLTRLALVNALYFKGQWATPFDDKVTATATFNAPTGAVDVPMMAQTETMGFAEVDGTKVAELAYDGGRFATVFVLPSEADGLKAIEAKLDAAMLDRWTTALKKQRIDMKLPRFDVEPDKALALKPHLIGMGMVSAFDAAQADFGGMSPGDDLMVDQVFHKAVVKMNESGTEAAAATAVVMKLRGMPPPPAGTFHADRPFLFFLRDTKTGMVLFAGRVENPTS